MPDMTDDQPRPDTGHADMPGPVRSPDVDLEHALSLREAADFAGVNERTLRRWITRGRLHAVKLGGQYRITAAELTQAVNASDEAARTPDTATPADRPDSGQPADRVDMPGRPGTGQPTADIGQGPDIDLAPLAELVREQTRQIAELSAAAAMWQTRALHLEEQLKQLTATTGTADEAPAGPERAEPADQDTEDQAPAPTPETGIWGRLRRWFTGT